MWEKSDTFRLKVGTIQESNGSDRRLIEWYDLQALKCVASIRTLLNSFRYVDSFWILNEVLLPSLSIYECVKEK